VVIDFIDMRDKKHQKAVEQALKQALKNDKARVTVGHISRFGLLELSRQRLRPAAEATTYSACPHCQGKGRIKSFASLGLGVLRQISLQAAQQPLQEVRLQASPEVAHFLLNQKRKDILALEEQFHLTFTITAHPGLAPEDLQIDYLKLEPTDQASRSEGKESRRAQPVDEVGSGKIPAPVPLEGHGPDG
jgi:ribonuclease E